PGVIRHYTGNRTTVTAAAGRDHDDGVGDVRAAALGGAGKPLRVSGIGHVEEGGLGREPVGRAGEPEDILRDNLLHDVAGDSQLGRDGAAGGIEIAGDIDVRDGGCAVVKHAGLAIRQHEALHRQVRTVND